MKNEELRMKNEENTWCLVLGAWCLVLGAWCLVLGAWCLVSKTRNPEPGTRIFPASFLGRRHWPT